jgi:hypothetical protein
LTAVVLKTMMTKAANDDAKVLSNLVINQVSLVNRIGNWGPHPDSIPTSAVTS